MIESWAIRKVWGKSWMLLPIAVFLVWLLSSPVMVSAFAGFGGYISEKMLGNGVNQDLYLGDGVNNLTVLGTSPTVSTADVTNNQVVGASNTATFNGNLISLDGMPQASVWFEWGYDPAALVHSTPAVVVAVAGAQSATLTGLDAGHTVYYRLVASTDSTSSGSIVSFVAGGGQGVSYWMFQNILPITIAATLLIFVLLATGNPLLALGGAVIGLLVFYIVEAFIHIIG